MANQKQKTFTKKVEELNFYLGIIFSLMFLTLTYYCNVFAIGVILFSIAMFELISTFLMFTKSQFVMLPVLFYQNIVSFFPGIVFCIVVFALFDALSVHQILDEFHLDKLKAFVDTNPICFVVIVNMVWQLRIRITSYLVVNERVVSKKNKLVNHDSSIRNALNLSAVTFFITMSHFAQMKYQDAFRYAAYFELFMIVGCACGSRFLLNLHAYYQSTMFAIPASLLIAVINYEQHPHETFEFLESYGLTSVSQYITTHPIFGTTILFTAWFLRMIDAQFTYIEKEAAHQIKKSKRAAQINRTPENGPNVLIDPSVPLVNTV